MSAMSNERRSRKLRNRPRSSSVAPKSLTREVLLQFALELDEESLAATEDRPRTRGECCDAPRPCPWVSCRYHLYLDVSPKSGAIKFNHPDVEPDELTESCALDIADRGGAGREEVGGLVNLSWERIRQIEILAFAKTEWSVIK